MDDHLYRNPDVPGPGNYPLVSEFGAYDQSQFEVKFNTSPNRRGSMSKTLNQRM